MANVYVRSGAGGAGTGADWANAYTTLSAAFAAKAAGDDFWVAGDHAESSASAITLTCPGTPSNPCRVICVSHTGSVPPVSTDLLTTATISTTGNTSLAINGTFYCRGVTITAGDSTGTAHLNIGNTDVSWWQKYELCKLALGGSGSSSRIKINSVLNPGMDYRLELENSTLSFGAVGQGVLPHGRLVWSGTSSALLGTVPTTLFLPVQYTASGDVDVIGVDLSAAGSGKNLVDVSVRCDSVFRFIDCKLGSSVSFTTGSITSQNGTRVYGINCDSADTNYRYFSQTYQGTITHETTIVRTSGASDGTTTFSRKMVTTANSKWYSPLESDWMILWNETTGSSVTVTIPVITDNVTLKDSEAWVEVEYLGTSGFPLGSYARDRSADVLASGTNQTTDSTSTWTTTGLTTPVKQSLSTSFTPQEKGPYRVRVVLAKASTTMYFDPKIQVS